MKLKSLVFVTIIVSAQPFSTPIIGSGQSLQQNFIPTNTQVCNNTIDFDALDKELDLLPAVERTENSWWITRQVKHFGTKIMIKALLGYIAVQEYCSEKWDLLCRKARSTRTIIKALVGYIKVRKYCNDTLNSLSLRMHKFKQSVMEKVAA